jgi:hypothetical protein
VLPTPDPAIIVVSGLPRSGTSLMMQILEQAGLPLLTDQHRPADLDNQRGYYEYEPVKFMQTGDLAWLESAQGKVIKVISHLLTSLPVTYNYKVVFMLRDLAEVVASQNRMLQNRGEVEKSPPDPAKVSGFFTAHLQEIKAWLAAQANIEVIFIDFNRLVEDPAFTLAPLEVFLGVIVTTPEVLSVVDQRFYRQRATN